MYFSPILFAFLATHLPTILQGDAFVFDAADIAAQLILPVGVLNKLSLDREAPHLLQRGALQLDLVENLGADFDDFVGVQLEEAKEIMGLI